MLYIKVKKIIKASLFAFIASSVLFAADSFALFEDLTSAGSQIFTGTRSIIYVVAGFGIFGIAIGGFFGKINWKWLGAIIIGLMVIALTAAVIDYMTGTTVTSSMISDTLINASGK